MARTRVKIHSAGVLDVFDQWAQNDGLPRMQDALAAAQALAPRVTGHYASRFFVEVDETGRAVVRLGNDSDYAMTVEASHGVLARALDAAGGKGIDASKIKVKYKTKSGKTIMATQAQIDNWTRGRR